MGEELVVRLVEFVESASPVVWAAARQQVSVMAFRNLFVVVVFLVIVVGSVFVVRWAKHKIPKACRADEDFYWAALCFAALLGCVLLVISVFLLGDAISYLMNPDYYAIEILLELF